MKVTTAEIKDIKVEKNAKNAEKKEMPVRRYHPVLDGVFTEEEAKKEIEKRTKS